MPWGCCPTHDSAALILAEFMFMVTVCSEATKEFRTLLSARPARTGVMDTNFTNPTCTPQVSHRKSSYTLAGAETEPTSATTVRKTEHHILGAVI